MPTAIDQGRSDLLSWHAARPSNTFEHNSDLQRTLATRLSLNRIDEARERMRAAGALAGGPLRELGRQCNLEENLPRLDRFSELGIRTENVVFHPSYHEAGRLIWKTGILADYATPGRETEQLALLHLFSGNGEFGHACPLACTAGLIKLLQAVGTDEQKERWLPGLLDRDYDRRIHASQFLTEVQGGSDVGSNAVVARHDGKHWRVDGEKWFCSVIDASVFLMTARPDGAPPGTRGLGLFLVPRDVDGETNEFRIRRLKWKLGTRAMASAEVDFGNAQAEALGDIDRGFKNVVERVLDTSRVYNAICCAGAMRRSYVEASLYAQNRRAFGQAIADYPLIAEALATLRAESMAALASTLRIAAQSDVLARGEGDEHLQAARRVAVNVNKYWTSVRNTQMARLAMEVFGGNGAIESFSILPQLYRDAMVLESWEGTHNTLVQQIMRDTQRLKLHEAFVGMLRAAVDSLDLPDQDRPLTKRVGAAIDALIDPLERIAAGEADQRFGRRIVDQMAVCHALVALLEELEHAPTDEACRGAIRFIADRDLSLELKAPPPLPLGLS